MIQRGLQFTVFACELAHFVVCVDLGFVDFKCFVQMFNGFWVLSTLKVNQSELNVSVRVLWIYGGVMEEPFEVLLLAKSVAKSAHLAADRAAEIHESIKEKERRK